MKWLQPKVWSPVDLACLKWCAILFGVVVGAHCAEFTKHFVWAFAVAIVLLAIRPLVALFQKDQ